MDLIVFSNGRTSFPDKSGGDIKEFIAEIEVEHLFSRIARIAKENNIQTVYCIIDANEIFLNKFISANDFGITVNVIVKTKQYPLHELFTLSSSLKTNPFCMVTLDSIFSENEFSMFIKYSLSQEDVEGIIAITHLGNDNMPLCVALSEEDRIIKFSNTIEGYNWIAKDIYFFYPHFLDTLQRVMQTDISDIINHLPMLIKQGYQFNGFVFSNIIEISKSGFPIVSDFSNNIPKTIPQ